MVELFNSTKQNISLHINNIFKEKELDRNPAVKEYLIVQQEGKRKITLYNLDVIISVGYRVKSQRGTQFRIWANKILKEYLLKGHAINQIEVTFPAPKPIKMKSKVSSSTRLPICLINYEYDFGDGWEHIIKLEKILTPNDKLQTPQCIAGKRNCPPEDCGGIWGYSDMLEILKQPEHKEYESYIEWLGDDFDPEYFNKDAINEMLKGKDFGCIWL
jgi:hypothetical protein